jgi:hypothetical protein
MPRRQSPSLPQQMLRRNEVARGGGADCVEKDIEIVPMQKLVTVLPEDTFGISKVLTTWSKQRFIESGSLLRR